MRAKEFIVEAKPENLGEKVCHQLSNAWDDKKDSDASMDTIQDALYNTDNWKIDYDTSSPEERRNYYLGTFGKAIADEIFKFIGPKNLIWAVKQYINDEHFFVHDLAEWRNTLTVFATITRSPRVQIERDINKYTNIDQLRTAIDTVTAIPGNTGSGYFKKAIARIDEMVQSGQAAWLYQGHDYVIYHPKTYDASHIMSALLKTNICTIMNNSYFDKYSNAGTLMYIIPNAEQDKLFNCFISKNTEHGKDSEFADEQNRHGFDLSWQLQHFPALLPLVKKATTSNTELYVRLLGVDSEDDKTKLCMDALGSNQLKIQDVPKDMRDYKKVCLAVVSMDGMALERIPEDMRDYDICLAAIKADAMAIKWIPENIPNYKKLCMDVVNRRGEYLRYIPAKVRDYDICLAAMTTSGKSLVYVPGTMRDYKMCLAAVEQNVEAMDFVPDATRAKLIKLK